MGMLDYSDLVNVISNGRQRDDPYDVGFVEDLRRDDAIDVPIEMTDLDVWANYMSDDLYEMDKKVREFLKRTRYKRMAKNGYRTTVPTVFAWMFGRYPDPSDGSLCRMLHELMMYYCTSYTGRTTYHGKPVNRVYRFTKFATNSKRPYSLRLRLEESRGESGAVFRSGPNQGADKRSYSKFARRADSGDGGGEAL